MAALGFREWRGETVGVSGGEAGSVFLERLVVVMGVDRCSARLANGAGRP